ncbi:tyrosine-protein kinase hopscotch [Drosophila miranda]|uniref:tyrosine-protein kinase hopscotch n=1 Tax=Drosophila miranda TaxID=7229 RepID=UPI0007E5BD41|nr:tyrosine-protein kinase hopscotch [Drosophila miranda]
MDDSSSGRTSLGDSASLTTTSLHSGTSSQSIHQDDGLIHVYNYKSKEFERFPPDMLCEDICTFMCRELKVLPTAQLLFGIREHLGTRRSSRAQLLSYGHTWVLPGEKLSCQVRYCFRMRFRVPELDSQLDRIDVHSHEYLYWQMRFDNLHEHIAEIRYPEHKEKVTGLAVMDMLIDLKEKELPARSIESSCRQYLPKSVWNAHFFFVGPKICEYFRKLSENSNNTAAQLKWHYIHQICHLAPTYMTEQFTAVVDHLPNEDPPSEPGGVSMSGVGSHSGSSMASSTCTSTTTLTTGSSSSTNTLSTLTANNNSQTARSNGKRSKSRGGAQSSGIDVYVRLWPHDSPEPGLKVARVTSEATLKWILVGGVEGIFMISKINDTDVRLEIVGLPKGYVMHFHTEKEMKSFISYLGIYIRLTVKWMQDLCHSYRTPSLEELGNLCCHGPIGGNYSLMKLHEHGDKCGSYIVRQCDREYNTYYIDINTRITGRNTDHERCKTETLKILRKDGQWVLCYHDGQHPFRDLLELAQFIPASSPGRLRVPASKYDKPPLLLLCLPKNLKAKKTDLVLSEAELQHRNPQIFNPKTDLQWYPDSITLGEDGMMFTMRGDWIQQSLVKDVSVTMKMLKNDCNIMEFFKLAQTWSLIQSPQFIKLYGLTLSDPYTMVMEYSRYGPLNKFLLEKRDAVSLHCLLDLMHGLVRGIHYLEDNKIIHSYIRCSNLYVTKFDPERFMLDAKISDPGYPRPYKESDSPWIPVKYYNNLQAAKLDLGTQLWAFATTIYEIFSRCQRDLRTVRQEELLRNRRQDGNILPPMDSELCPTLMYDTIMDGWSDDAEKRFSHHDIFSRLVTMKSDIQPNYTVVAEPIPNGTEMPNYNQDCVNVLDVKNMPQVLQLDGCRVFYSPLHNIGKGHYGTVYRGTIEYDDRRPSEIVAIKKLNTMQVTQDFQREIVIMRNLEHTNVVKFKYWDHNTHSIIMEYLDGSFDVYLRYKAPDLNTNRLLGFAIQIAQGMNYLSGKGLIHRDLAARNILVDRKTHIDLDCVKISDFGLAQFANSEGYYYAKSKRDIPFKWYSPEALHANAKFSSFSDVWSYGVTLYEMFTHGEAPNLVPPQENEVNFTERLNNGERLPQSPGCPDFVYNELMLACWNPVPRARPTFSQIIEIITAQIGNNVAGTGTSTATTESES